MKAIPVLLALLAFATPAFGESDTHCVDVSMDDGYIELRNTCNSDVHYHYCIVNANTSGKSLSGAGPMAALHDCANDGGGFGRISAGGRDVAVQSDAMGENSEFRYFACAMPRLPEDWDWRTNRGYCRGAGEKAASNRQSGPMVVNREDRRLLQMALTIKGFDTGGADGQFGPKTQAAIKGWQESIGQEATGQLTASQIRQLLPDRFGGESQQAEPSAGGGWEAPESVTTAAQAAGGRRYGSIVYARKSGGGYAGGIAWDQGSRDAARRRAIQRCRSVGGGEGCREVGWFRDACGALALSAGGGYGTGWGEGTRAAEAMALSECRSAGNADCRVEISRCSSAGGGREAPEPVVPASAAALSPKCDELPGSYPAQEGSSHAFAQCWQELDDVPGCFVYRDHYHSGDKVTRGRGECRSGVVARGSITIEGNAGVSKGPIVEGKRNGRWVLRFADGGVQEGPIVEGKMNGRWVLRFASGNVQEGPYVDDKKNGRWVLRLADGGVQEGPYVNGKANGRWVLRFADGDVQEGPFVNGKRNGRWVERFADGNVFEGPYVDDKKNGRWVERFASGNVGEGPYVDDKRNGRFNVRAADGTTFDACFRAGSQVDCN